MTGRSRRRQRPPRSRVPRKTQEARRASGSLGRARGSSCMRRRATTSRSTPSQERRENAAVDVRDVDIAAAVAEAYAAGIWELWAIRGLGMNTRRGPPRRHARDLNEGAPPRSPPDPARCMPPGALAERTLPRCAVVQHRQFEGYPPTMAVGAAHGRPASGRGRGVARPRRPNLASPVVPGSRRRARRATTGGRVLWHGAGRALYFSRPIRAVLSLGGADSEATHDSRGGPVAGLGGPATREHPASAILVGRDVGDRE